MYTLPGLKPQKQRNLAYIYLPHHTSLVAEGHKALDHRTSWVVGSPPVYFPGRLSSFIIHNTDVLVIDKFNQTNVPLHYLTKTLVHKSHILNLAPNIQKRHPRERHAKRECDGRYIGDIMLSNHSIHHHYFHMLSETHRRQQGVSNHGERM